MRNKLLLRHARIVLVLAAYYAFGARSRQSQSLGDNARGTHAWIADSGGDAANARTPVASHRLFDQGQNIEMREIRARILAQKLIEIVTTKIIEYKFAIERLRKRRQIAVFALGRTEDQDLLRGNHRIEA